jgi:hypothetical protein
VAQWHVERAGGDSLTWARPVAALASITERDPSAGVVEGLEVQTRRGHVVRDISHQASSHGTRHNNNNTHSSAQQLCDGGGLRPVHAKYVAVFDRAGPGKHTHNTNNKHNTKTNQRSAILVGEGVVSGSVLECYGAL